ncbi:unnamed protein product [Calicophoron daubneyi]|uniref:DUF7083 domain-containing protein n=1 Tax=Calicophoron daubneyi TaxID=300641 RepID=A0AAV2TS22_CALDB
MVIDTGDDLLFEPMASVDPDLKQMMQSQMRLMEALSAHLASLPPAAPPQDSRSVDHIAKNILDFLYNPQAGVSCEAWYKRYEDILTVELAQQGDETKVSLLLRKLVPAEPVHYTNNILPDEPRPKSFKDTVTTPCSMEHSGTCSW